MLITRIPLPINLPTGVIPVPYFHVLRSPDRSSKETTSDGFLEITTIDYRPELVKFVLLDRDQVFFGAALPTAGRYYKDKDAYVISTNPSSAMVFYERTAFDNNNPFLAYHLALLERNRQTCPSPARRYREYFAELNLNTHLYLIGLSVPGYRRFFEHYLHLSLDRLETILQLTRTRLELRLSTRGWLYDQCRQVPRFKPLEVGPSNDSLTRRDLEKISKLLLHLTESHFCSDVSSTEEAFEMFVNGELRLQLPDDSWTTQPNSGGYFLLGELALLAIQEDVDRDRWSQLMRVFIRTQRILPRVYPAINSDGKYNSFAPSAYESTSAFSASEKALLKKRYDMASNAELEILAAQNAIEFLHGEVRDVSQGGLTC